MKNILSEIYQGNYDVLKRKDRKGTAFAATLNRMNELETVIRKALPDDVKDAFDAYIQAQADLADMACEEDFISGYQLGVQMLLAGLDHDVLAKEQAKYEFMELQHLSDIRESQLPYEANP